MKLIHRHSLTALGIALSLFAGCAVGPDYKRPVVDAPTGFRTAATDTDASSGTNSFADSQRRR